IILGEKYKLQKFEKANLGMSKNEIYYIKVGLKDPDITIENIKKHLSLSKYKIIVINMDSKVHPAIITYLTNIQFTKNISVCTMEHFLEHRLHKCYIPFQNDNIDFLDNIRPYSAWQYFQKRCIDYFGVFWLFFFSWPVMIIAAVKIKLQSPGSVLFRQQRVGKNNQKFECVKFRSMHENSEFFNRYTQEDDPRIFPWGNTMRKTRIDELPQMLNILKGEMHLIGPRTEWDELVRDYEKTIPYYNERHLVAPGITGWAQVNYPYGANIEDTRQKLMYDLYYIKYWSIWLELKIVWKTAMTVIGRKGV
ncbi:MAG: sugar transferase, partial [Epsilonproteobacteria bacterium]|nr:sugar transferase [Campylobacterota bacterium]